MVVLECFNINLMWFGEWFRCWS